MTELPEPERRQHLRLAIVAEAEIALLLPHETFSPHRFKGITTDLSSSGVRLKTSDISRSLYADILRGMTHAKVTMHPEGLPRKLHVTGRVVWSEFHDEKPPYCYLGIVFYSFDDRARKEFEDDLVQLAKHMGMQ